MSDLPVLSWDAGLFDYQRKLGNFVQYFQINLPTNGHGIPLRVINPLVIAENMLDCDTTDDVPDKVLSNSLMTVDYDDGIPIIDGVPFWERFDGELIDYYKLFKEYRELMYSVGARAISKLSETSGVSGKFLTVLSKVYHWQLRCRAYDIWKKQEFERKRHKEVELLEAKHSKAAQKMLEQGLTYLESHPEQMNPKLALQMVQTAVKVGRLAIGLNPEKPNGEDAPKTSVHVTTGAGTTQEVSTSVEIGPGGQQSTTQQQDLSYLQSVLHILDKSGALDKVRVVDAEYSVVNDSDDVESA